MGHVIRSLFKRLNNITRSVCPRNEKGFTQMYIYIFKTVMDIILPCQAKDIVKIYKLISQV